MSIRYYIDSKNEIVWSGGENGRMHNGAYKQVKAKNVLKIMHQALRREGVSAHGSMETRRAYATLENCNVSDLLKRDGDIQKSRAQIRDFLMLDGQHVLSELSLTNAAKYCVDRYRCCFDALDKNDAMCMNVLRVVDC